MLICIILIDHGPVLSERKETSQLLNLQSLLCVLDSLNRRWLLIMLPWFHLGRYLTGKTIIDFTLETLI